MWRRAWIMTRRGRRGLTYAVRWYDDRNRLRTESAGPSKRNAEDLRRRRELEMNAGMLQTTEPIRLKAFASEHVEIIRPQIMPGSAADQALVLRHLVRWAGDVWLEKLTPGVMERYIAHRAGLVKAPTVNREIRTLKAIFERAKRRTYLKRNPLRGLKPLREPERTLRVLTAEEVEKLLTACPSGAWRAFVFLALTTGMRRGELTALQWADVDVEGGCLEVRCTEHHLTKSGRNRTIALTPDGSTLLAGLRRKATTDWIFANRFGRPWGESTLRSFRKIVKAAEIARCTPHDLRRTFCSHLAMAGVSEAVVMKIAGHASADTTRKHYTRILPEAQRAAPLRLPWARGIVSKSYHAPATDQKAETA